MNPKYPVYVISKGRWESRLTVKALTKIGVPHKVIVEPQEFDQYAAVMDPKNLVVTPFSNLGQGSIPARNFVWELALKTGAERHWILDDNIRKFHRFNKNVKVPVYCGNTLKAVEDFTDRYENVGLSGMQYHMFIMRKDNPPPLTINTRIYSCILIRNDLPMRWRGRYNEDTDLSIRVLKSGLCTILFNAFLAEKITTMTMKGGNKDELYKDDGRLAMALSLQRQHPDCVKLNWKWNRWQHQVDYRQFKGNKLILKPGVVIDDAPNEYGMKYERLAADGSTWETVEPAAYAIPNSQRDGEKK